MFVTVKLDWATNATSNRYPCEARCCAGWQDAIDKRRTEKRNWCASGCCCWRWYENNNDLVDRPTIKWTAASPTTNLLRFRLSCGDARDAESWLHSNQALQITPACFRPRTDSLAGETAAGRWRHPSSASPLIYSSPSNSGVIFSPLRVA